jgi:hypothetical protein
MKKLACVIAILGGLFFIRAQAEVTDAEQRQVKTISNGLKPAEPHHLRLNQEIVIDLEKETPLISGMDRISSFAVDTEGNVYFYQQSSEENFIFKFNEKGNYAESFGRKGQGPGELQFITSLYINKKNEISVLDIRRRRLVIFGENGDVIQEKVLQPRIYGLIPLANGNVLTDKSLIVPESVASQTIAVILCASNLEEIKELKRIVIPRPDKAERFKAAMIENIMCVSDSYIYLGEGSKGYNIQVFDLDGNLVRIIRKKYKPQRVSEDYRQVYISRFKGPEAEALRKKIYFPREFPPFQYSFTDENNNLFVMTYEAGERAEDFVYDIFNQEGIFVGRLSLNNRSEGLTPLDVVAKNRKLYCLSEKESRYKKLTIYKMEWED